MVEETLVPGKKYWLTFDNRKHFWILNKVISYSIHLSCDLSDLNIYFLWNYIVLIVDIHFINNIVFLFQ